MLIYKLLDNILANIHLWFYLRNHTMKDFERRMIELGCTKVNSGKSIIFTTPNKKGKVVVTENEILINPK